MILPITSIWWDIELLLDQRHPIDESNEAMNNPHLINFAWINWKQKRKKRKKDLQTGTICVTPSPLSTTTPVKRPLFVFFVFCFVLRRRKKAKIFFTLSIQSQNGLNGDIDCLKAIFLKHDLHQLFAIRFRIHRRLSKQQFALWRINSLQHKEFFFKKK